MPSKLYILYNADATVMGKLNYSYRKLTSSKCKPACAACDLTHGGLHLDETDAWKRMKAQLGKEGVEVRQLHRDEVGGEVKEFVQKEKMEYPMVLAQEGEAEVRAVMEKEELASFGGDAEAFVAKLREKGGFGLIVRWGRGFVVVRGFLIYIKL